MSVPEQVPYKEYRATGSNNSFEITFYLPDPKDLVVMVNKEIPLVGAYSIQGNTVVFGTPPNEGDLVELTRDTQMDRETNFKSYDNSFRPETINFDLDKIWLVLQESNLVDAKILARLKQEIEWRRTHDFNYDELAQVREKQLFDALKGYSETLLASTNPGVFQGVVAGVVFARDGKSIQTHLEEILENLVASREDIDSKAGQEYVDEQLALKAPQETTYTKVEVDTALSTKAPQETTYTKLETDAKFSAYAGGRKGYTTLALAQADLANLPVNTVIDVTNDPTASNNGTYQWNGSSLTKSAYDPVSLMEGRVNSNALYNPKNPGSTNLNNLSLGFYLQSAPPTNAVTELNYPLREACYIHVEGRLDSSLRTQSIYFPNSKRDFKRDFDGTNWQVHEITNLGANVVTKAMLTPSLRDSLPKYSEWSPVGAAWNVTYNPATKTLSWPHMLLGASADYPNTLRIRIPAGSIQVTNPTGYDYIYLDLTNVDPLLGNVQLSDVKVGTYAASGYLQKNNQVLLAKLDFAGNIHAGVGVPKITTLGQTVAGAAKDTFRFVKQAAQSYLYLPATNGNLIRYNFYRQIKAFDGTSPDSQSDVWRLADVYEANPENLAPTRYIVVDGEWDTAIRVMGAADHSGGVHGDELISELQFAPYFLVDGCKVAQNATFDGQVKELIFVQESLIYFENTQNVLCKRLKVMKVTKNGFKNYQKLVFQSAANLFTAWFGLMIPIKRTVNDDGTGGQITDTAIRFPNYIPEDVSVAGFPQVYTDTKDGDEFVISGATSGISIKAKMSGFKGLPKPVTHISSAQFYNKLYFSAIDSRVANYTTQVGETWEVTSEFAIDIK